MSEIITIVSGLPRSGTSMMMQMLQAGGMEVVTDEIRKADEDNLKGYFEFEKVKTIRNDASWLDSVEGKAVKIISDLLFHLPGDRRYKIIFMLRDLREVLASQRKMMRRRGSADETGDEEMAALMESHLDKVDRWLKGKENIQVLYVRHSDIMKNPREQARAVEEFLGRKLNVGKMGAVIEDSLYRNR